MESTATRFLHDLTWSDLEEPTRQLARLLLLDLLGVAAGGRMTMLSDIICDHVAMQFSAGTNSARMLFDGRRVSPTGAALAGGMTIDALDAHDGHKLTKGHVGCGVLPALLALAEAEGVTDAGAFLTSLVVGYEIGTRAGIALHRTACDYHTSGAWVAVAAAGLCARVLGLDASKTREALGIAEYHGPRSQMMRCIDHPTMVKDGSGWGAMAGVSAGYLARSGFTGAPATLVEDKDVSDIWADLGQNWRLFEQYFKPYPVCRWAQPSVQAVLNLRAHHGLTPEMVERIEITTFHQAIRLATRHPQTTEEAQYSTAFPAASALVRGGLGADDVAAPAFADPEINRLAASMTFTESEKFNAAFPAHRFAEVTLSLKDGTRLSSGATEAVGDPENPVPPEQMITKFQTYAVPVLGQARSLAIQDAVLSLDHGKSIAGLLDLVLCGLSCGDNRRHSVIGRS